MAVEISPVGGANTVKLLHHEGEDGWVYEDWRLTAVARAKMTDRWPTLDLPWVDLAAKEFASAWSKNNSSKHGFVGLHEDNQKVSVASAKLMRALKDCAIPARIALGKLKNGQKEEPLYDQSIAIVAALIHATDQLKASMKDVDARRLPRPLSELIIKLACQLRYAGKPRDSEFKLDLVSLTLMTLDGLELRHSLDIRSAVRDVLKSRDQRLNKLR